MQIIVPVVKKNKKVFVLNYTKLHDFSTNRRKFGMNYAYIVLYPKKRVVKCSLKQILFKNFQKVLLHHYFACASVAVADDVHATAWLVALHAVEVVVTSDGDWHIVYRCSFYARGYFGGEGHLLTIDCAAGCSYECTVSVLGRWEKVGDNDTHDLSVGVESVDTCGRSLGKHSVLSVSLRC